MNEAARPGNLAVPLRIALRVGEAFDRLGVRWAVVGALAACLHGTPRPTEDVDLVAELDLERIDALVADLQRGFFVDRRQVVVGVQNRTWFSLMHLESMTRVDVFLVREPPLSKAQIDRRVNFRVYESEAILPVLSAEDTVLQALDWYRRGERRAERQFEDAVGVLRTCGKTLDRAWLKRGARGAKLTALLEKAMAAR